MRSSFFWFLSQKSQPYSNQLHTGSFLCTCTVPSPPLSCLLLCGLTSQYGVTQRTERLELEKNLRGRARGRWEKSCNTSVGTAPLYRPFYTQVAFPSILPGYSASPCKECHQLGKYWADFLNQARTSKKTLVSQQVLIQPTIPTASLLTCTPLNPICFQCNYLQEYSHRRV